MCESMCDTLAAAQTRFKWGHSVGLSVIVLIYDIL